MLNYYFFILKKKLPHNNVNDKIFLDDEQGSIPLRLDSNGKMVEMGFKKSL